MIEINYQEKDLEDYLCKEKNFKKWFPNLKIVKRQFQIFDFFVDILAYDNLAKCFVIIELKKNELNANSFIQAIRYKNCLSKKYINQKFYIILLGEKLNPELFYCVNSYDTYRYSVIDTVYYYLYHYSFEEGINFHYINTTQQEIERRLEKIEIKSIAQRVKTIKEWRKYNGDIQEN